MTDYAVGDIQGCHGPLRRLLAKVDFSPSRDRLWVTGDLVNRGPESLATLRYIESLGDAAVVVLGNHDLHLLAVALGGHSLRAKDTLQEVLEAPDRDRLLHWLRRQHLCVYDPDRMLAMAHAGVPHIWSLAQALACAREVEAVIRGDQAAEYFQHMYGNEPACWHEDLTGQGPLAGDHQLLYPHAFHRPGRHPGAGDQGGRQSGSRGVCPLVRLAQGRRTPGGVRPLGRPVGADRP